MRIVAGKFRAKRIEAPKGLTTRPTSDRVRQALFNVLEPERARACEQIKHASAGEIELRRAVLEHVE